VPATMLQVLLSPHISEKSARIGDSSNQVVFKVVADATKPEVKEAVEKLFDVEVEHVRITNTRGKVKGFKGRFGRRSGSKKAYVRLKPGNDIDFTGAE